MSFNFTVYISLCVHTSSIHPFLLAFRTGLMSHELYVQCCIQPHSVHHLPCTYISHCVYMYIFQRKHSIPCRSYFPCRYPNGASGRRDLGKHQSVFIPMSQFVLVCLFVHMTFHVLRKSINANTNINAFASLVVTSLSQFRIIGVRQKFHSLSSSFACNFF